eukprot:scaffold82663_cov49-Phaeocystis_antarctica.AAC.2
MIPPSPKGNSRCCSSAKRLNCSCNVRLPVARRLSRRCLNFVPREPSALGEYMMPLHQMPAANPEPERLDETSVKTIQPKVNSKLDPAVPVRACRRA